MYAPPGAVFIPERSSSSSESYGGVRDMYVPPGAVFIPERSSSSSESYGGYDYKFVNPPPDSLICLICTFVAKDPRQRVCCGRVFCHSCLQHHSRNSSRCPSCRQMGKVFEDRRSERDIKALAVQCNNDERGCKWEGELRSLEDHLTTCSYAIVGCPNDCEIKELLRVNLQDHLQNECPEREYECPHCHEVDIYDYIVTEHQNKCPSIEVPCPNQCGLTPIRGYLGKHRNECPNEVIDCRYADIDCKVKRPRKDMEEHEGDSMLHLHLAMDTVARLNRSQQQEQTPVFCMPRFEMKRSRGEGWKSPPFYTQPGGYRMCISVDANGYGDGEDTHISVFVYLMRGKNDDNLSWPFRGKVTITLLNQLEDKNHHTHTLTYPEDMDDDSNRRVVDSDMGVGYGEEYFIDHDELGHNAANNCQYLKDDRLYFRITAKAADPVKPWLTCTV